MHTHPHFLHTSDGLACLSAVFKHIFLCSHQLQQLSASDTICVRRRFRLGPFSISGHPAKGRMSLGWMVAEKIQEDVTGTGGLELEGEAGDILLCSVKGWWGNLWRYIRWMVTVFLPGKKFKARGQAMKVRGKRFKRDTVMFAAGKARLPWYCLMPSP